MNEIEKMVFEAAQKDSMKHLKVFGAQHMYGNHYALYNKEREFVGEVLFEYGEITAFYQNGY